MLPIHTALLLRGQTIPQEPMEMIAAVELVESPEDVLSVTDNCPCCGENVAAEILYYSSSYQLAKVRCPRAPACSHEWTTLI